MTVEAYVPEKAGSTIRNLYEDDGQTNGYLKKACRWTSVSMKRTVDAVTLQIGKAQGSFNGALNGTNLDRSASLAGGREIRRIDDQRTTA